MKSLAKPGRPANKILNLKGADILTWGGLIVFLVAVSQLIAVGHFKKDLLLGLFNFHLSDADRGEILWTMMQVAVISLIIATGQYARALIAAYAIFTIFTGYGTVAWIGNNAGKDLADFSFSDLPNVTVTRGSSADQVNTQQVRQAAETHGLKNCGNMTQPMLDWCDEPYNKNRAILNKDSSDIAKLRCSTGILYKKSCTN